MSDSSEALLTGGAGFIGSHLAHALAASRPKVGITIFDNLSNGDLSRLAGIRSGIRFIKGDIRDPARAGLRRALMGVDTVFHLAAMVSVPDSMKRPGYAYDVNAEGTRLVMEEAARAGVRRVVYASSCALYGDAGNLAISEETPARPMSPYALSKWMGECYALQLAPMLGIESAALRFFNVYGPGQRADSPYAAVIPRFAEAILAGKRPVVFGDGRQTRDFVFVADVAGALLRAAFSPRAAGEVVNVGSGKSISLLMLLRAFEKITGRKANPNFLKPRKGDIPHSRARVAAARRVLGFRARTPLLRGLKLTVDG